MNFNLAFIYGFIQGISEFLPVSSSGHLALLPKVMNFTDPGVFFDLMMHVGTAVAVLIYFYKDVLRLIKGSFFILLNPKKISEIDPFVINFISATVLSVVFILLIKGFAESFGRSSQLIAVNLIVFGAIMFISDLRKVPEREFSPMEQKGSLKAAIIIGITQAFAIFPGVSRSGITITAGRFLNLSRREASTFSFLLSLPIILAGAAKKLLEVKFVLDTSIGFENLLAGLFVSFVIGILTIHFFLKMISKTPLIYFSIYRIIIGIIILINP